MALPDVNIFDNSLVGESNSIIARAVGYSEGNRTKDGQFTNSYYGHSDPGNQKNNIGSFSWQHGGTPEEADKKQIEKLKALLPKFKKAIGSKVLSNLQAIRLWAIVCDLFTQSEIACVGKGGLLEQIESKTDSWITINSIIDWRVRSYKDPNTGKLDAPGFGNSYQRLYNDQKRRVSAVVEVIDRFYDWKS
jgi:hypothetical protein